MYSPFESPTLGIQGRTLPLCNWKTYSCPPSVPLIWRNLRTLRGLQALRASLASLEVQTGGDQYAGVGLLVWTAQEHASLSLCGRRHCIQSTSPSMCETCYYPVVFYIFNLFFPLGVHLYLFGWPLISFYYIVLPLFKNKVSVYVILNFSLIANLEFWLFF